MLPSHAVLATSGIDYDIKLWEPTADAACCLDNIEEVVELNETMLKESRNTITVPTMFVFRILSYLNRRQRSELDLLNRILWQAHKDSAFITFHNFVQKKSVGTNINQDYINNSST